MLRIIATRKTKNSNLTVCLVLDSNQTFFELSKSEIFHVPVVISDPISSAPLFHPCFLAYPTERPLARRIIFEIFYNWLPDVRVMFHWYQSCAVWQIDDMVSRYTAGSWERYVSRLLWRWETTTEDITSRSVDTVAAVMWCGTAQSTCSCSPLAFLTSDTEHTVWPSRLKLNNFSMRQRQKESRIRKSNNLHIRILYTICNGNDLRALALVLGLVLGRPLLGLRLGSQSLLPSNAVSVNEYFFGWIE